MSGLSAAIPVFLAPLFVLLLSCSPQSPALPEGSFVTDGAGEQVALLPVKARVLSLAPNMTEIFCWLSAAQAGAGADTAESERVRLIAVSEHCDWPDSVTSLPRAGSLLQPDYERIARMKPDIVLASCEGNPPALASFLKRAKIPLYVARVDSLASLYSTLTNLSHLFFPEAGMVWEEHLTESVRALRDTLGGESVFFQIGDTTQAWSFGKKTLLHDLVTLAGARNLGASHVGSFPQYDGEALARLRPSLVILLSGTNPKRDTLFWERYAPGAKILSVPPSPFERPGPRLVQALREFCAEHNAGSRNVRLHTHKKIARFRIPQDSVRAL